MTCSKAYLLALVMLTMSSAAAEAAASEFFCSGSVSSKGVDRPETAYLSLQLHGSLMFWASDDGHGNFEIPGGYSVVLGGVEEIGERLFLYKFSVDQVVPDGIFSKLSNHFEFRLGEDAYFEGNCREKH